MTFRAVILGVVLGLSIGALGYVNDSILRLNFVVGNHFPISVFGALVLLVLLVNPLLQLLRPAWRFRGAELAVIVGLALGGCAVPGSSMMRSFTQTLILPLHYNENSPGWQSNAVLDYFPDGALVTSPRGDMRIVEGFHQGMRRYGQEWIAPGEVPWNAWAPPLLTWGPIVLLVGLGVVCLALVVHRQWATNERLRYPVAEFASMLAADPADRRLLPPVLRSRLFWLAFASIAVLRTINGIHAWHPGFIQIPLVFDVSAILTKWPFLREGGWHCWPLVRPQYFPLVVAFAFFLASDVSLSLGLSTLVYVLWTAGAVQAGITIAESQTAGGVPMWFRAGAYAGLALLLLYTGRRYYGRVLRSAIGLPAGDPVEPHAVWGMRIGLLAAIALAAFLILHVGLDPLVTLVVLGVILMLYVGVARMNAEAGLIWVQAWWQPAAVLLGLFGARALGPANLAMVCLLSAVLTFDAREILMPFVVNALRLGDRQGVRVGTLGAGTWGVYAAAFVLAVPVVLWANYNFGIHLNDAWSTTTIPRSAPDQVEKSVVELRNADALEASQELSPLGRLQALTPAKGFLASFGLGIALVGLFSVLRLRLPWWPLHPILFLTGGTWAMDSFGHSFLLGWVIKSVITRFGTTPAYRRGKEFMAGVIAAELLAGLAFMLLSALYLALTGTQLEPYLVLPR